MNKSAINCKSFLWLLVGSFMVFFLSECKRTGTTGNENQLSFPPQPNPKGYVCYKTPSPINPDGIMDEHAWNSVPWTDDFVDIEGDLKPLPKLKTHAKLLWDDQNLYIGADLEEPHVWANLKQRDTVIFFDNDFEVFIDPDGDTHTYYELEVNAFGTPWDLLLIKPYRDGGLAVNGWDIAGLKVGTHVAGTINDPGDTDKGWSVEIVIPLSTFKEWSGIEGLPEAAEQWRIDFSRVEWRTRVENGSYKKEINPQTGKSFPEDNWVWSPQGRINMHMPEMWGYLQFSSVVAGTASEEFIPDKDLDKKWALRLIYYAENEYFKKRNTYSSNLNEIGLKPSDLPENLPVPVINSTRTTFESYLPEDKQKNLWTIYHDGRLVLQTEPVSKGDTKITVYTSSSGEDKLARKPDLNFESGYVDTGMAVVIDEKLTLQKIEGFGATFNEAGMICLNSLKPASRDSVLMALFDPENGAGYTAMKSPIAACDFASAGPWYSYNDTKGDTLMENFSIERDLKPDGLIPFIKSAAKYGSFKIESPMDFPPDWMLYGLQDGQKHVRKEYYAALARYYSKFISEYARNGVTIDYLNPFNEPQNSWYSNETYKAIGIMVKDFIVPRFRIDGIRAGIQLCETANRPEAIQKLPDALDDPDVRKHVNSITVHGYDWDKFSTITQLHDKYPDIPIWQTEVCYATKSNVPENGPSKVPVYNFSDGEFWGNMIMNDMKNWASAWIYWNMILDEKGGPWLISDIHGDPDNNFQHPVVVINRQTGKVSYTGLYYYLAHFSRFIRPDAYRIQSSGGPDQINHSAFKNSNGTLVLVLINNGEETEFPVRWNDVTVKIRMGAHSVSTLTWKS